MAYDGKSTMDFLLKQMNPDEKWLDRFRNGFNWAYSKFGQTVTVREERHPDYPEDIAYIFTISSRMLKGVKDTPENRKVLNDYLFFNTSMCVPVFTPNDGTVRLLVRAAVNESTYKWMGGFLSIAMAIQQHEVLKNAEQLAQLTHSEPLYYVHPKNGMREDVDEILKVYDDLIVSYGKIPSKCTDEEMKEVSDRYMQRFPCVLTTQGNSHITTEFPLGEGDTSLCEFDARECHVDYGTGLNVIQTFFKPGNEDEGIKLANYHNWQLSKALRSYGMGSFVYRNGFLVYRLFVPNFAYEKGLLLNLFLSSVIKAKGMNKYLGFPDWTQESYEKCIKRKLDIYSILGSME